MTPTENRQLNTENYLSPAMEANPEIHLVIPGLFGPFPRSLSAARDESPGRSIPRLIARADREPFAGEDLEALLFLLFSGSTGVEHDLPSAAIGRLGAGAEDDAGWWMHADPVFLKADRDRLLLFDGERLDIHPEEAQQLGALFNAHFSDRGWRLQVDRSEGWYLRLTADPGLRTHPLERVVGRNIDPFLPEGSAGGDWRSLMNEVQMLFHTADVNQQRRARGLPPINSLWFWGGGRAPQGLHARYAVVYAQDPFTQGLARLAGVAVQPPPEDLHRLLTERVADPRLLLFPALQRSVLDADLQTWLTALGTLERDWIRPLSRALMRGQLSQLSLFPCNGRRYRIGPRQLLRLWRRPVHLLG